MSATAELRIQLLGGFRVLVGDRPVPTDAWRSRRASALVKLLALAPAFRLPREQIADTLWPDFDIDAQLNNLNVATTRARGALTASGAPHGVFLTRDGAALALGPPELVRVDVRDFERGAAEGWRTLDPATCRAALAFYAGDLLPDDAYEEWVEARRTTLRAQFLGLLARLARLHEERGEPDYAIEAWQRYVAMEPADETANVGLIRLHHQLGRTQRALAQYDLLVANLRRHLDAEPSRETAELMRSLLGAGRPVTEARVQPVTPEPAAGPLSHGSLPLPLDDLIGREREIAGVRARLAQGRLVTLTGPGGIGKTRLALAVAHELETTRSSELSDGAVFVDLAPVVDPDDVLGSIAQAVHPGQTGEPSLGALSGMLASRRYLLVLDNFEQVIDAAPTVTALLERARGCRVLVTSRVPLRVRGEIEYPVPPLPLPDAAVAADDATLLRSPAVELFVRRARDTKPDFVLDATQAAAVAGVCRRLDGLPLAIELAAARAKLLSPVAMLNRLDHPLALLVGGARDLPQRQQTIRATISWSYTLLSPAEQRLFRRLGAFVGGWTLESAEAVVAVSNDLGIDVLDGLGSLVDKNLVVQQHEGESPAMPRFTMLETIREFAVEHLAGTPDDPIVRARHADYMVLLAEQSVPHLEGRDLQGTLARLDREQANLRAALQWLIEQRDAERALQLVSALQIYWFVRGRLTEGCDDLLTIVAMPESADFPEKRIDALNGAAYLARETADYDRAFRASTEALEESRRLGDDRRAADAMANLGYVVLQRGDPTGATTLFEESLRIHRSLENRQGIADALSFLGVAAHHAGRIEDAWRFNEESLGIWDELGDHQATIWARTRRGMLLARLGDLTGAYREFARNLEASRDIAYRWGIVWSLYGLANVAAIRGERELATDLLLAGTAIRETVALRLPPVEQAEIDQLGAELGIAPGAGQTATTPVTLERLQALSDAATDRLGV